jgi:benzoylformate decarboxylase
MARMLAKHAFMDQLVANGVKSIFGNPGTTELAFMETLQDYPQLQYILALQEAVAMGMAEGYARASGRPAFVNLHVAAGLGNAMGMLYNAARGGTPMVVTAGQQDTRLIQQEPLLWGNLVETARQYTKWSAEVQRAEDLLLVLSRAFKVAAEPPQGPVFVSLPQDILDHEIDATVVPTRYTAWRTRPDPQAVERAAALLAGARRPVVLCGDGVSVSGAQQELVRLVELVGARAYTAARGEVNIPTDHPQHLGGFSVVNIHEAGRVLGDADVLLCVGMPVFTQLFHADHVVPETARLIHLDINTWEIGKNYQPEVGLVGDPKYGLEDLAVATGRLQTPEARRAARERAQAIAQEKKQRQAIIGEEVQRVWDRTPISPYRLMGEVRDALPPGAIIVGEGGSTGGAALSALIELTEPGSFFRLRGGGLGFGLPATLGVKLARPDRPVLGLIGEGEGMYTVQALWTAAHYRIPVTYIVFNNGSYRILKLNMNSYLKNRGGRPRPGSYPAMDLDDPPLNFAKIAAAFGIPSRRVSRPEELRGALAEAFSVADGPALVDVAVDAGV